jgi:hypothetical protein
MVPGLSERAFHAFETIRREWLASESPRRAPQPLSNPTPVSSRFRTGLARFASSWGRNLTSWRSGGLRGPRSAAAAAVKRG